MGAAQNDNPNLNHNHIHTLVEIYESNLPNYFLNQQALGQF